MPKKTKPLHDRKVAGNATADQRGGSRGEPNSTARQQSEVGSESSSAGRKRSGTAKPRPESSRSPPSANFPVVGIGASAGGLESLQALFGVMPVDTGMAFVVMTHQHPGHNSLLPELLGRSTNIPVVEATDGIQLVPNQVFVSTPGAQLAVLNGVLHRMESSTSESPKLPIDYFFQSLAADTRERAIGIILSGTGGDGSAGLRAINEEAGMVMVEEPRSAKYAGMPAAAIATGLADYVLAPELMPQKLLAYIRGPFIHSAPFMEERPVPNEPLQKILILLRNRTGHDFSAYKINTLRRRIERRMNVHQILEHSAYVRYLQVNPHEIDVLFKELLISVTSFFRDPEAWESLAEESLPLLLKSRPEGLPFRAWVPGCATGEEAFTVAICLREALERLGRSMEIQIFGTDLDSQAIEAARVGQYPEGISGDVTSARLERFFTPQNGGYRIHKNLRELVVFAPQNVIKDPPFTKLDFLSCRNVLIYLNSDLQKRLLPVFHYALKPGGLLLLGPSETIGRFNDLFETVDKRWKIYRRKESAASNRRLALLAVGSHLAPTVEPTAGDLPASPAETHIARLVEKLLLSSFAPASVVVNDRGDVVYIHGRTGAYLEPAEGQPRHNLLEMAREGLQPDLAAALRQAQTTTRVVVREQIRVKTNGGYSLVNVTATKIHEPEPIRGFLLVTFSPSHVPAVVAPAARRPRRNRSGQSRPVADESGRVTELEVELQHSRATLSTTVEELETANEDLKSANEELQSTNEEVQSTIEELETSKEELQSLNQELTTVNTELQAKVNDLSRANDDMQNLLNSTDTATVFLDLELNIKRFTGQARNLIMLRQFDLGRPLSELSSKFDDSDLLRVCHQVLRTLEPLEEEVHTRDGVCYLMRILPYRTANNVVSGLVLTFVDINRLKDAQTNLRRLSQVFLSAADPLLIVGLDGRIDKGNDEAFKVTAQ